MKNLKYSMIASMGVFITLIGVYVFKTTTASDQNATAKVEGKVVGFTPNKNPRPIIEFTTPDGKKHNHTAKTYSAFSSYKIGQTVSLYYNPNNTEDVSFGSNFEKWGLLVIFIIAGLSAIGFSYWAYKKGL